MQAEDEKILNMFGKKGTLQILEFLDHGKANCRQIRLLWYVAKKILHGMTLTYSLLLPYDPLEKKSDGD